MTDHAQSPLERLLLVLDYDGTATVDECNELILQRFTGDAWRPLEARALNGSLTHAECFRQQFALVHAPRDELFAAMAACAEPAPGLAGFLGWALAGGARVAVVSVGFREAIERVWQAHGLPPVEIFASELGDLPEGGYTVLLDDLFGDCPRCGPGGCKGAALRALRQVGARGRHRLRPRRAARALCRGRHRLSFANRLRGRPGGAGALDRRRHKVNP
jgi:hypothetical protein